MNEVIRFCPEDEPVTATVKGPVGVAVVVVTVKVEFTVPFAAGVTDVGTKPQATVALTGVIAQVNATPELKLLIEVTIIVEVVLLPAVVLAEAGTALKLKSFTETANVVVRLCVPEVPVTVTV